MAHPKLLQLAFASGVAAILGATALPAAAQVTVQTQSNPVFIQVQGLAPQLLQFAGSAANLQALVNGLSQGLPVTLVTLTPDGQTQSATFTPGVTMQSAADIARTLEQARQSLITRGITNPTAEQIAVTLVGGSLPTPVGRTQVAGVVSPATTPTGAANTNASTGGSAPLAAPANRATLRPPALGAESGAVASTATGTSPTTGNVTVQTQPTAVQQPNTSASPYFGTSDTPILRTTPGAAATGGGIATTTGGSGATASGVNGPPSPAAQLQGRR